jgi:chromosomal replication initiator protein
MVDIDAPDFETRLAILQQKAREREFIVPQEVAEYIAYNLGRNVREIEGILNQMVAEYELDGLPANHRIYRFIAFHQTRYQAFGT